MLQWLLFSGNLAEEKIGFGWLHGTAVNTVKIAEDPFFSICGLLVK